MSSVLLIVFFFFQAEDGIRDYKVTGVQTCALPIWQMATDMIGTNNLQRRAVLNMVMESLLTGKVNLRDRKSVV